MVKIKLLLLVGKNPVGNNILGKTLSTSFIWSSFFSVFFVSYLFIVLNILEGKKKLHIILIFTVQYAWRKHSAPPFPVVISWKCMPPYHFFSPKPSRKPRKKKTRAICDVTASFSVLLLFSWGLFLFHFNWIA